MKIKQCIIILIASVTIACETQVDLKITDSVSRLVVQGAITTLDDQQTIILSNTAPYSRNQRTPRISDAIVAIEDNIGNRITLTEQQEKGKYMTPVGFKGVIGRSYMLHITLPNGEVYESFPEMLYEVPGIDDLVASLRNDGPEDTTAYYASIYFSDSENTQNYYRWKFFINGQFMDGAKDLYSIGFDKLQDGKQIELIFFEFPLNLQDMIKVEQLSLTKSAQDFFYQMEVQTKATGGPFDAPVAPIIGNIRKKDDPTTYALGYFYASDVVHKTLIIN